jgi:hypothetical protein
LEDAGTRRAEVTRATRPARPPTSDELAAMLYAVRGVTQSRSSPRLAIALAAALLSGTALFASNLADFSHNGDARPFLIGRERELSSRRGIGLDEEIDMRRLKEVAVASALALSTAASAQNAVQWRVEDGGNGHWYAVVANPAGEAHWTFASASSFTQSLGAHLVTFSNQQENAAVYNLLQIGSGSFSGWIGLVQAPGSAEPAGGWGWVTGEPLTFSYWQPGEPNNSGCYQLSAAQHWGTLEGSQVGGNTQGRWDDDGDPVPACMNQVRRAVIEWSSDCNNDGLVDYGQILAGQLADTNQNGVPDTCEVDPCPGDITGNNSVDGVDLAALLAAWGGGKSQYDCDVDNDGLVGGSDLAVVLAGWGACP